MLSQTEGYQNSYLHPRGIQNFVLHALQGDFQTTPSSVVLMSNMRVVLHESGAKADLSGTISIL